MYIAVDKDGNIKGAGGTRIEMDDCETIEITEDIDRLKLSGYIYKDGKIAFDDAKWAEVQRKFELDNLRILREEECFSVINRGDAWYKLVVNTEEREKELQNWYQAWLDVTDTENIPKKPEWIK